MYPKTSKPQEGSTCKDSLSKRFMTTNLYREAFASEVLRTFFHLKFYTSIEPYILLKYLYKTQFLTCR